MQFQNHQSVAGTEMKGTLLCRDHILYDKSYSHRTVLTISMMEALTCKHQEHHL